MEDDTTRSRPEPSEAPGPASETQEPWDERAGRISSLASEYGLRYWPNYPSEDPCEIQNAPFRWMKRRPELSNVIFGSYQGTEIVGFDYTRYGAVLTGGWESGGGSIGPSVATASCALAKVIASAPRLRITPWEDEGRLRRLLRIGGISLDDPGFRRVFHVKAKDRAFARALLQPAIRDLLLIPARDAGHPADGPTAVAFEIRGRWIACSSPVLPSEHIVTLMLEPLKAIADRIPAAISEISGPYRPLE